LGRVESFAAEIGPVTAWVVASYEAIEDSGVVSRIGWEHSLMQLAASVVHLFKGRGLAFVVALVLDRLWLSAGHVPGHVSWKPVEEP